MDAGVILLLSLAILAVAVLAGAIALRRDPGAPRGSEPGEGHHEIEVVYDTGAGGGTQRATYRIPRDPQDYAKLFVPKEKTR